MGISLILAIGFLGHGGRFESIAGQNVWEETAFEQKMKEKLGEYSPKLRFNREMTYLLVTPDFIQRGKYSVSDNHYTFHAVMANEIENSDVNQLAPEMGPRQGQNFREAYARSMSNWEADFNPRTGALMISYPVKGMTRTYFTYPYTNADTMVKAKADDPDMQDRTLWHSPEPFPEKMTARDRLKFFGLEGLQKFFGEASASDGAQFGLLDLRPSHTYRMGSTMDQYSIDGQILTLKTERGSVQFTFSPDGSKLMAGKKVVFQIN